MNTFLDPRFAISYTIILLFGGAYIFNERRADRRLCWRLGLLIGSSSGAAKNADNTGKALDIANAASPNAVQPDVTLKPGQTAQAAPDPNSQGLGPPLHIRRHRRLTIVRLYLDAWR